MLYTMIYFSLFECCKITKGAKTSCIFDIERNTFCSIPNDLYDVLEKGSFEQKKNKNMNDYLEFLQQEKFIYFKTTDLNEKSSEQEYHTPFNFDDIVIDIISFEKFSSTIEKVNPDNFETIQLRFFCNLKIKNLTEILDIMTLKNFGSVEILFNHDCQNNQEEYIDLFYNYTCISKLVVMGYTTSNSFNYKEVFFVNEKLQSQSQCGLVHENLFNVNLRSNIVSRRNNSCLYKKIAIDSEGNIRNCPSMAQSFGNIKDTTLKEALDHKDFKKYWNLTKDHIEVCKDCEFRYICTDCRAYTERTHFNSEGLDNSKPLKCGYNPYMGEWDEWSSNPLKQQAIKFYSMEDFVKNA